MTDYMVSRSDETVQDKEVGGNGPVGDQEVRS